MRTLIALTTLALVASVITPRAAYALAREQDFVREFRASYYLERAVALQALVPEERAARLRTLASDPLRSYEVFPLCRMLFEPRDGGTFRRPSIGGARFLAGTYQDWPLEPITLSDGVPFLIVSGYLVGGKPESAARYVAYCLANCRWSQRKYTAGSATRVGEALERLLSSKPSLRAHADWLRQQIR